MHYAAKRQFRHQEDFPRIDNFDILPLRKR